MKHMGNRAYIFDMDGVLVNNCRYHVLAWRVFSKKHGFELTDEQVLEWMGTANRVYMERLLGRPVADDELTALENEKESLYRELYAPQALSHASSTDSGVNGCDPGALEGNGALLGEEGEGGGVGAEGVVRHLGRAHGGLKSFHVAVRRELAATA